LQQVRPLAFARICRAVTSTATAHAAAAKLRHRWRRRQRGDASQKKK
jgi:hypothetical protein